MDQSQSSMTCLFSPGNKLRGLLLMMSSYGADLSPPVQHLSTFVLDRKDGLITVDDGIRRLRLLDAKGKVWTQEMLLQVEEKSVSLIDQETKVRLT